MLISILIKRISTTSSEKISVKVSKQIRYSKTCCGISAWVEPNL